MSGSLWALIRASRGPLVLIALGILFALDHNDVIGFGRTWPILIILIGVMKLIERMVAPPVPPLPPPPPVMPGAPMGGVR